MHYFERIETSFSDFDIEIIDKEYILIENSKFFCSIPLDLEYEYMLNQYQKKNFITIKIFPYTKKRDGVYFLKSFKII